MKKAELEQLRALKQEVDTLESRYISLPKKEEVGDSYGDYRSGYKVIKIVQGHSTKKADDLAFKIRKKTEKLNEKINKMEVYLDTVDDAEMRDILRLYYAVGLTHEEIGEAKGYSREAITKKLDRYWKENTKLTQI